jgi:hypothetical protein
MFSKGRWKSPRLAVFGFAMVCLAGPILGDAVRRETTGPKSLTAPARLAKHSRAEAAIFGGKTQNIHRQTT